MFTAIAQKLSGKQIESLTIELHDKRQALHDIIDAIKRLEVLTAGQVASERKGNQSAFPNEDIRKAEVLRRLENNNEYMGLKEQLQNARMELAFAEADLENAKANHDGMVAMSGIVAALISTGQVKDLKILEDAANKIFGETQEVKAAQETAGSLGGQAANGQTPQDFSQQQNAVAEKELESGIFRVIPGEVRESSPGTQRAYCESQDGRKVAIYGKNGVGRTILGAQGKQIEVWYKKGNRGLIATSARIVG